MKMTKGLFLRLLTAPRATRAWWLMRLFLPLAIIAFLAPFMGMLMGGFSLYVATLVALVCSALAAAAKQERLLKKQVAIGGKHHAPAETAILGTAVIVGLATGDPVYAASEEARCSLLQSKWRYSAILVAQTPNVFASREMPITIEHQPKGHRWQRVELVRGDNDRVLFILQDQRGGKVESPDFAFILKLVQTCPHADAYKATPDDQLNFSEDPYAGIH